MGCSGNRGGQRVNPLAFTNASSFGPVGRYSVIVSSAMLKFHDGSHPVTQLTHGVRQG